ncbi:hypothetical protein KCU77_g10205, partial [Aureobasidium melanogenum]
MEKLQNEDMRTVLDAVDELRAVGVNNIIALPQIVACGDQSTGKSSLLEALTGIPFPRDTGLCTRFATQFILHRADEVSISVTIIPGPNRNENERERLEDFGRGKTFDPTKLGELIEEATQVMGLPPLTGKKPKVVRAFSHDVLSIAISSPDRPSLTLVDTPSLIKSKGKYQSLEDIKTTEALVKSEKEMDFDMDQQVITNGRRLRALVQDAHRQFSSAIRRYGSKFEIVEPPAEWRSIGGSNDFFGFPNTTLHFPYSGFETDQKKMTYTAYITYVHDIEKHLRGTQLSGMFNPDIVNELFNEQSSRWSDLARAHISNVDDYCNKFVQKLLHQIAPRDIAGRLEAKLHPAIQHRKEEALKMLDKFLQVERSVLMTYDPEFTTTVERLRTERKDRKARDGIRPPANSSWTGGSPSHGSKVPRTDTKTQNMDGLAAEGALCVSWIYYRSQREHFVAYLTKHVIEPYMIKGLDKIMSPKDFGSMTDEETRLLATEAEELIEERKGLLREKEILEKGKAKFDAALKKK